MPRPRKRRCLGPTPPVTFYKPQGVPLHELRGALLMPEGFEALRLVDAEGLSQEEAAARMEVSRPTLSRILGKARTVVARALANGWAIRIEDPQDEGAAGGGKPGGCGGRRRGCRHGASTYQPETKEAS